MFKYLGGCANQNDFYQISFQLFELPITILPNMDMNFYHRREYSNLNAFPELMSRLSDSEILKATRQCRRSNLTLIFLLGNYKLRDSFRNQSGFVFDAEKSY